MQTNDANSHGVCHGDDIYYIFSSTHPHLKRIGKATETDKMVQQKMLQLWINFVQHSNPTPNPGTLHKLALSMRRDIYILYNTKIRSDKQKLI